jgi:N-acetylgalactosamine kinase
MEKDNQYVPVFTKLEEVYSDLNGSIKNKHEPRFINLRDRFKQQYGVAPKFYCRAPGRVNIIGEHIDYCGYSVLPAAIEQDFIIAYLPVEEGEGSDEVQVANIDKAQYPHETISTDPFQKLRENAHFMNYFLCGYKAILAHDDGLKK